MKKLIFCIISMIALLTFRPSQSMATTTPAPARIEMTHSEKAILARLEEIKNMDKDNLTASEKKALRKEVRASKRQMSSGGGVYLSVGAVIIIILLLIILL
jgi:hypothetical protein